MIYVIADVAVLEGPSGLDMAATEKAWIITKLSDNGSIDEISWESNTMAYLINRHKLKATDFVDYLMRTFGMLKVTFTVFNTRLQ